MTLAPPQRRADRAGPREAGARRPRAGCGGGPGAAAYRARARRRREAASGRRRRATPRGRHREGRGRRDRVHAGGGEGPPEGGGRASRGGGTTAGRRRGAGSRRHRTSRPRREPLDDLVDQTRAATTLWAAHPTSTSTAWGIHAVGADTSSWSGDGVRVAVLDTGIDASHPAFDGVELVQRNFTGESDEDLDGHGTHCAGHEHARGGLLRHELSQEIGQNTTSCGVVGVDRIQDAIIYRSRRR